MIFIFLSNLKVFKYYLNLKIKITLFMLKLVKIWNFLSLKNVQFLLKIKKFTSILNYIGFECIVIGNIIFL